MLLMSFENWFYFITLVGGPIVCVIFILVIDFFNKRKAKKEFDAMVEKGTQAWADIQNATDWVEDIRGND